MIQELLFASTAHELVKSREQLFGRSKKLDLFMLSKFIFGKTERSFSTNAPRITIQ